MFDAFNSANSRSVARFLTTKGCLAEIEAVITSAQSRLVLITPFVQITDAHARRLRDAAARGVKTVLVCRHDSLKPDVQAFFAGLDGCEVYDDPSLHAKCFVGERGLVLTSLNLYGASEQNNEMGVWLDAEDDRRAYTDAVAEAASIQQHARCVTTPKVRWGAFLRPAAPQEKPARKPKGASEHTATARRKAPAKRKARRSDEGMCLRCGDRIPFDPGRPYCLGCFREWAKWEDPTYQDRFCHACGIPEGTASMEKPLCYGCYKEHAAF